MMMIWRLKKGSDKKFRLGHPWVFSNELDRSPKGAPAGCEIELQDFNGHFLARGYGHPNSLISFRTLSLRERDSIDADFFHEKLMRASRLRTMAGVGPFSHRLCFAEGDGLPGLIIDRYRLVDDAQVFVVQSSTAGMDVQLPRVFEALEKLTQTENGTSWARTSILVANDSKSRVMENIEVQPKRVHRQGEGFEAENARLVVQPSVAGLAPLQFHADLIGGQKTGFFLDQRFNIQINAQLVKGWLEAHPEAEEVRVLDLCCYVGQWGTQIAHLAHALGRRAHVTSVDASAKALELAGRNVEAHGGRSTIQKMDVLDGLEKMPNKAFDIVICDPPAFIKKKKDLPTGTQAYFKMNREALRKTAPGGVFVSCSCSGLFTEDEFRAMLARVSAATGGEVRWLARGGHSPDHPQRPEFPQGTYLKSWFGINGG